MGGFELGRDESGPVGKLLVAWRRALRVAPLGFGAVDRARLFFGTFLLLASAQTGRQARIVLTRRTAPFAERADDQLAPAGRQVQGRPGPQAYLSSSLVKTGRAL